MANLGYFSTQNRLQKCEKVQYMLLLAFAPSWPVYMGHLLELKYAPGTLECGHFSYNKCSI